MIVTNLSGNATTYTSNAYLVTGNWNTIADVNTMIDVGRDSTIIDMLMEASTGVGKKRVEQVIITHSHYDHASLIPKIRELFNPRICAFSRSLDGIDHYLVNGEMVKVADRIFEVIHTPGHSNDSICLYSPDDRTLFSGDTPIIIQSSTNTFEDDYKSAMQKLFSLKIETIYPGHGAPITDHCDTLLRDSRRNIFRD